MLERTARIRHLNGLLTQASEIDRGGTTLLGPAEMSAAYDSFIAGAASYGPDGRTLMLKADFRKNPNEMTGETWQWGTEMEGDTVRFVFVNPPFLPGREWRLTVKRIE